MKNKTIFTLIVAVTIILAGLYLYYYQYNKSHIDVGKEEAEVTISAKDLFNEYSHDESMANSKYTGKIIVVNGIIKSINENAEKSKVILLSTDDDFFGVSCYLDKETNLDITLSEGDKITLKGTCDGYLSDVVIRKCIIIKQ